MRVLLSTYGSRGDVEPLAALAVALKARGVEAIVCAPPDEEFVALLDRAGVPLAPAFSSVRAWVSKALANPGSVDLRTRAAEIVAAQYEAIGAAARGCDAIVATGLFPSTAAARLVSETTGTPYVYAAYCPMFVPSEHHRPFAYPAHPHPPEVTDNRALWKRDIDTMQALFGWGMNAQRETLGLPPVDNVRDHVFTDRPWLASDPVLSPWAPTDLRTVVQTGVWILPDERPLPAELEAFLAAGEAPVYVGFGSMPMAGGTAAEAAIAAARARGRRVVLLQGWAGLAPIDDRDDVFVVGDVNQQALFPRVAAVVHHGGAGTTTAASRAGAPQVVVPQVADQPYWASRVAALGIGAAHEGPGPTFESVSAGLAIALSPETAARARVVAGTIRGDGAAMAAGRLAETVAR